jgi:hypothetical protein
MIPVVVFAFDKVKRLCNKLEKMEDRFLRSQPKLSYVGSFLIFVRQDEEKLKNVERVVNASLFVTAGHWQRKIATG